MKGIKLRAWHPNNKSFVYATLKEIWENGYHCCQADNQTKRVDNETYIDINTYDNSNNFFLNAEWKYFTGLEDKNGKEIYEGDIVVIRDIIGIVIFKDGGFCFDTVDDFDCDYIFNFTVEIIGNIYENPELLK